MEEKIIFFVCTYLLFAMFLSIYIFTNQVLAVYMAVSIGLFYIFSQSAVLNRTFKTVKSSLMHEIARLMKHQ